MIDTREQVWQIVPVESETPNSTSMTSMNENKMQFDSTAALFQGDTGVWSLVIDGLYIRAFLCQHVARNEAIARGVSPDRIVSFPRL